MTVMQFDDLLRYFEKPEGTIGTIIADHMDEEYAELNKWAVQKMDFRKTDRVLEIGFGTGMAIHHMTEIITQGLITGIDFSELMVQQASHRNAEAIAQARVVLHEGDIQSLPEFGQQFDKILAINNMMYWKNPILVLQHLSRYLKPAGCLSIFWIRTPEHIASQKGQDELKWYIETLKSAGYVLAIYFQPVSQVYRTIQTLDTELDQVRHSNPCPIYGICIQAYKKPTCNDITSFCKALLDITKITINMLRQNYINNEKSYLAAYYP